MQTTTKQVGTLGEKLACQYLKRQCYYIWETNWNCKVGELDIIARHQRNLVFVEVKARRVFGLPTRDELEYAEALTSYDAAKHKQVNKLVDMYIATHKVRLSRERVRNIRIDLIALDYQQNFLRDLFCKPKIKTISHFEAVWNF